MIFIFLPHRIYYSLKVAMTALAHNNLQNLLPLKWFSLLPSEVKDQRKQTPLIGCFSPLKLKKKNGRTKCLVFFFKIIPTESHPRGETLVKDTRRSDKLMDGVHSFSLYCSQLEESRMILLSQGSRGLSMEGALV